MLFLLPSITFVVDCEALKIEAAEILNDNVVYNGPKLRLVVDRELGHVDRRRSPVELVAVEVLSLENMFGNHSHGPALEGR